MIKLLNLIFLSIEIKLFNELYYKFIGVSITLTIFFIIKNN